MAIIYGGLSAIGFVGWVMGDQFLGVECDRFWDGGRSVLLVGLYFMPILLLIL
jgi:hypothetical protein